ncbi:MAG TPA: hypothetical protein VGG64_23675 [Pirellulales bacterium]|jgi:hypothetical protein
MSWLVEDPTPTLVALVLFEAILTIALVKTGRGALLGAIAGVALLGGGLLVLEWFVVTEKERVEDTLAGAASALESNNPQAVIEFIDPTSPMRREVAAEMSRLNIQKATFRRLDVTFNRHISPPTAKADFMGYINVKDRRGEVPYENFAGRFVVDLRQEGGRWLMTGYDTPGRQR